MQMYSVYGGGVDHVQTGDPTTVRMYFRGESNWSRQMVTFFVDSNRSMVIEGRIGEYHDNMTYVPSNEEIRNELEFTPYAPGDYNVSWGFRLYNGTVFNDSFVIYANGSSLNIGRNATNESEFYGGTRERYGSGGVDVVRQRLLERLNRTIQMSVNRTTVNTSGAVISKANVTVPQKTSGPCYPLNCAQSVSNPDICTSTYAIQCGVDIPKVNEAYVPIAQGRPIGVNAGPDPNASVLKSELVVVGNSPDTSAPQKRSGWLLATAATWGILTVTGIFLVVVLKGQG